MKTNKMNGGFQRSLGVLAAFLAVAIIGAGGQSARAASVLAWGWNQYGQLGDGTTTNQWAPVPVTGLTSGVTAVAEGSAHSVAIKAGGVWAWGQNTYGQLGDGTTGDHTTPMPVSGLESAVTAVSACSRHTLALKDGGVWSWGYNGTGELGDGTQIQRNAPVLITSLASGVTAIASGDFHGLALQGGGVYAWGLNNYGQIGDGTTEMLRLAPVPVSGLGSGVTAISAGYGHNLAIKDGALWAWGWNNYGQLGDGTTNSASTPLPVSGLSGGVTAIAAGGEFSLVVKDGGVWTWGRNLNGELGDGTKTQRFAPMQIDPTDLHDITAIAVKHYSSYALSADGSLWVWGANGYGQLGLGDTGDRVSPTHLLPPTGYHFTSIGTGDDGRHVLATLEPVPEPGTLGLLAVGAICVLGIALRRRRA
jgi:alpha-tubulin suppressor-like RCC1 family protein